MTVTELIKLLNGLPGDVEVHVDVWASNRAGGGHTMTRPLGMVVLCDTPVWPPEAEPESCAPFVRLVGVDGVLV